MVGVGGRYGGFVVGLENFCMVEVGRLIVVMVFIVR